MKQSSEETFIDGCSSLCLCFWVPAEPLRSKISYSDGKSPVTLMPVFLSMSKPQHLLSKVKERRAKILEEPAQILPKKALDFWPLFFVVLSVTTFWQRNFILGSRPAKHRASRSATHTSIHVHATLSLKQMQFWIYTTSTPESVARD